MGIFLFLEVKTKIRLKRAASGAGVLFNITGGTWRRGRGEGREEGGEVVVVPECPRVSTCWCLSGRR